MQLVSLSMDHQLVVLSISIVVMFYIALLSKEVWKLNFRQYGEMEMAQPGRNSDVEKVRREKIRDGESQKREDAGAQKGRKVAKHCVFPMFCGSGGSKSRLPKAAGAVS